MKGDHRTLHDGYANTYWNDNTACGWEDEWTRAEIIPYGAFRGITVDNKFDRDDLTHILDKVFEHGKTAKAAEIRHTLGIRP